MEIIQMTVKKAYAELVAFLEANKDKKVSSVMDQVIAMASAKTARAEGNTFIKDAQGNTVAILDYYFKRWMPLVGDKAVEFGAKAQTATGFNTMCKEGVSAWTKQQREAKAAGISLLQRVANGEVKPSDIPAEQEKIENARKAIAETTLGFASLEEVQKYLRKNGVQFEAAAA